MQISILNGIYSDATADFRTSYPVNFVPVAKENGISAGYLRTAEGITQFASGPGVDRSGIEWNGELYRVMGSKLVKIDSLGVVTELGDVGLGGRCTITYSFDRLAIQSGTRLYYWDGTTLAQVTDPDLGDCLDVLWIDGYFVSTDGEFIAVTELSDPFQVDPLKYGSSEIDPDPIKGLLKYRNEVYALNRFTIEVFDNVGGTGFPFQRIEGAMIPKGLVGKDAKVVLQDGFAFLGSGRNEGCAVYLGAGGVAAKLSTREVDEIIQSYTEFELAEAVLEYREYEALKHLYVHLPQQTLVYDFASSQVLGQPVWFYLSSDIDSDGPYRARNFVYVYNKWLCGDTIDGRVGEMTQDVITQYGQIVGHRFETAFLYNESRGAQIHSLELVALPGRAPLGRDPRIFHSWTHDGLTWSNERESRMGVTGQTQQRVVWRRLGLMRNYRGLRFRSANDTPIAFARLEAEVEGLV
jgi:hypothetical protein